MKPQEVVIRVVVEQAQPESQDDFSPVAQGHPHTPSQELRWALRRRWLARGGTDEDFEPYYQEEMARIISVVEPKPKGK